MTTRRSPRSVLSESAPPRIGIAAAAAPPGRVASEYGVPARRSRTSIGCDDSEGL